MKNVGKLSGNIGNKLWYSVNKQIWGNIENLVTIHQFEQAKNQLRNQVRDQVSNQGLQEVRQNVNLCRM